jgi:predicted nucleic acid-binding protein
LQARVFELRHDLTAYDGMCVARAEALGLPLLTDDGKFATTPVDGGLLSAWLDRMHVRWG